MTIALLSTVATALTAVVNIQARIAVASVDDQIPAGSNSQVVLILTAAMAACSRPRGGRAKGHAIKRDEMATARTGKHVLKSRRVPLTPPSIPTPVRTVPTSMIHAPLPSKTCPCGNGTLG